jgi:hypothetical protein
MRATKSPVQIGYQQVQSAAGKLLKDLGFKRKGSIIFTAKGDNFGVIHLQSHRYSTKTELSFTVKVGVIIGKLADSWAYSQCLKHPSIVDAQVRLRIGDLLPERQDKWWTITDDVDIVDSSKDFAQPLLQRAVPFIQQYMVIENVISAWEHDAASGLTDMKGSRYLAQLKDLIAKGRNL